MAVRQEVVIFTGIATLPCTVLLDLDSWPASGTPGQMAGSLEIPRPEWGPIAECDRLVMMLRDTGEPYRMILDGATGRFVARQL